MAIPKENEVYFASNILKDDELYMVSPVSAENWGKKVSASNLKFRCHFTKSELPAADLEGFGAFISSIPIPVIQERILHITWLETLTDMAKSKTYLLGEGKRYQILYLLIIVTLRESYWCLTQLSTYMSIKKLF